MHVAIQFVIAVRNEDDAENAVRVGVKERSGVVVVKVFEDSPAAKGGLKVGDVLHSINGKPVRDGLELQKVVAGLPLNQPVDMSITRDKQTYDLKLTVQEQPETFGDTKPAQP